MRRAVIGLGANLGDRLATLESAARSLERLGELEAISAAYETAPVGTGPQPDYLNAAAVIRTRQSARELLRGLLQIEREHGRERRVRWDSRTLDLDILWIEGETHDEDELHVPHPRLLERAFALVPLLEVCPDATDPASGKPYRSMLGSLALGAPFASLEHAVAS